MSVEAFLLSTMMAMVAGLMGCFATMRRMVLAADPLSHVALPGIGIALALHCRWRRKSVPFWRAEWRQHGGCSMAARAHYETGSGRLVV